MKKSQKTIAQLSIIAVLALAIVGVVAAQSAPWHQSITGQYKEGALRVGGEGDPINGTKLDVVGRWNIEGALGVDNDGVVVSEVTVGSMNPGPYQLDVTGEMLVTGLENDDVMPVCADNNGQLFVSTECSKLHQGVCLDITDPDCVDPNDPEQAQIPAEIAQPTPQTSTRARSADVIQNQSEPISIERLQAIQNGTLSMQQVAPTETKTGGFGGFINRLFGR